MRLRGLVLLVPLLIAVALSAPAAAAQSSGDWAHRQSFTVVVIPDTQVAVQDKPELFYAQTDWILRHRRSHDIAFVVHVGDVVEWPARVSDWQRAASAMHRLDGVVPYAVAVGNHDMDAWACTPVPTCDPGAAIAQDRSTTMFNTYFPWEAYWWWPSFGGSHPRRAMDNSFFTFRAGGVRWLVVTLAFAPTDDELAWAARVVDEHPHHHVIVDTHEYQRGDQRSAVGERIWDTLGRRYANIQFILSGHYVSAGRRIDSGDSGNRVYQIQADYQNYRPSRVTDNSYLRLMTFDTAAGTVDVQTFSPYCATTGDCPAYLTDSRNHFTLSGVRFFGPRS